MMSLGTSPHNPPLRPMVGKLRALLPGPELLLMPCCFDALSARLIERAGFQLTFMEDALAGLAAGRHPEHADFAKNKDLAGYPRYLEAASRYEQG